MSTNAIQKQIEKLGTTIADVQAKIDELNQERQELVSLPLSSDEAEEKVRQLIRAQRERGAETIDSLVRFISQGKGIDNRQHGLLATLVSSIYESSSPNRADLFPVLATLFADQLEAVLVPLVRQKCEEDGGISEADRSKRLEEIDKELLKLEQQEESAISEAEINDIWTFRRRDDFRPEVVLGIAS